MLISRVGSDKNEANTITIPAGHQQGDIMLIFAFRDGSTTNPTIPSDWNPITSTLDGTLCSVSIGWKIANSGAETSGTWSNASLLMVVVYRFADIITPFGTLQSDVGTVSPSTYGSTKGAGKDVQENQWFVAFQGHRSTDTTTLNTAPTGYTNLQYLQGANSDAVLFDTNGIAPTGFASNTVDEGGTDSGWITAQLPIFPAMPRLNNYQGVRSTSAGVISVSGGIR